MEVPMADTAVDVEYWCTAVEFEQLAEADGSAPPDFCNGCKGCTSCKFCGEEPLMPTSN